jgi:DNA sulfur modification protein DndB
MADYIPALKAKMGDWQYYVTVMKLGKIARECRIAEDIRPNQELNDLIQREITNRVEKEMVPYLLKENQRFYGALVVAVYGGEPEFSPVTVDEHPLLDDTDRTTYGFGLLRFDGSQIYYALDGQHRLKSIQKAIEYYPDLAKEEISVIILKHEETPEGLQRTRRLFSTLNRRAKPTTTGQNIAIDEDDAVAIVSRQLVKENEILKKIVSIKLGSKQIKSLSKADYPYITTLAAFYETNSVLLGCYEGGLEIDAKFKQFRPSNNDLEAYYLFLEEIWISLLNKCPRFDLILNEKKQPGDLRKRLDKDGFPVLKEDGKPMAGGSVFARPFGQFIVAEAIKLAHIQGKPIQATIDAIMDNISMDIDCAPWVGIIWNPSIQRIMGSKAERVLLSSMICHALGLKIKSKVRDLKQKYRDTLEDPKASLLPPIDWSGRSISENTTSEEEEEEKVD